MNTGKILTIGGRMVTILIVLFTVCVMVFTIVSVNTVDKKDASLFGYRLYIVLSDSMSGEFQVGDITVSKTVDPASLKEGDIVTFQSIDPANYGEVVTHKIREVTTYEGNTAFVTYGTATGSSDAYPALQEKVIGQYRFHLPLLGYFFQFLKTTAGYITVIFLPFLLLLLLQGFKFVRLVKRRRLEQQADIDRQKAEMAAERRRAQDMMQELQQLRDRLSGQETTDNGTQDQKTDTLK